MSTNARGSRRRSRSPRFGSLSARVAAARARVARAARRTMSRMQRVGRHTASLIRGAAAGVRDTVRRRLPRRSGRASRAGTAHGAANAA